MKRLFLLLGVNHFSLSFFARLIVIMDNVCDVIHVVKTRPSDVITVNHFVIYRHGERETVTTTRSIITINRCSCVLNGALEWQTCLNAKKLFGLRH